MTRVVKVEGCDYRVSQEMLLEWLGLYGEILSDLVEDVFEDSEDSEGDNTTGIYSVKMKLNRNIPQLLPIDGRHIKIYYRNINKLCTSCFGQHNRRDCKQIKVKWTDYVASFIQSNPQINPSLYGKWKSIVDREKVQKLTDEEHYLSKQVNPDITVADIHLEPVTVQQEVVPDNSVVNQASSMGDSQTDPHPAKPKPEDFNLPANPEEWKELIDKLMALGLTSKEANASLDKRRKLYNNAIKDYSNIGSTGCKKGRPKSRKNSLNDI